MVENNMKKWIINQERWEAPFDAEQGNLEPDNVIEVTENEYERLQSEGNDGFRIVANNGVLEIQPVLQYSSEIYEQLEANAENLQALQKSDWKVIRELERLYLQGTDLNIEREAHRSAIATTETPELK